MSKPVKLSPFFKDYIWGGEKLKTIYGKKSDLERVAESWELACHKDGESRVSGGEFDKMPFGEYLKALGEEALGTRGKRLSAFPLLIKLIDANSNLSVQVHPDDDYAKKHEGEFGKTEMWYVLDCEEDAYIYYGFKRDVTKEEYEDAIKESTLEALLNKVKISKGDVFFIPPGTVHAIGKGILICEIQQNSNTTYRVYDYNRRDKDGKLRPLHIEKAIEVSDLKKAPLFLKKEKGDDTILCKCDYFTVRRLFVKGTKTIRTDEESFQSLIVTEGEGTLKMGGEEILFSKGDSIFIPAQNADAEISGDCEIILTYI